MDRQKRILVDLGWMKQQWNRRDTEQFRRVLTQYEIHRLRIVYFPDIFIDQFRTNECAAVEEGVPPEHT